MNSLSILIAATPILAAQLSDEGYREPPVDVVDIVAARPAPVVRESPDGAFLLLVQYDAMPTLAELSRPMLRLAGVRIDPAARGRHRTSYGTGLALQRVGAEDPVPVAGGGIASVSWSHDSRHFAWTAVGERGTSLWLASVDDPGGARELTSAYSSVLADHAWMPGGASLVFPVAAGTLPEAPTVPAAPSVFETSGDRSPLRTYQDLLATPYDADLFAAHVTTTWRAASLEGELEPGFLHQLGADLWVSLSPSPDGESFLVERLRRPFSYVMPWYRFPSTIEVVDRAGEPVHVVAEVPLGESIPIEGVRTGPRSVSWKAGEPATLVWVEALDGGDPEREAEHRDRWRTLAAPFEGEPAELVRIEHRASGLTWLPDGVHAVTSEYDRDRRWVRALLHHFEQPGTEPAVLEDRAVRDRYGDPGDLVMRFDEHGSRVVLVHEGRAYRVGAGASPEGSLPFLDRQDLLSLETERLWRAEPGSYESVQCVVETRAEAPPLVLTRHETPDSPPNWRLRDLADGSVRAVTRFPDPTPEIRGIEKRLLTYERADGVPLSATLYLPADYEPKTRLPLLVWAYPLEFNDASTAGQVTSTPWRFTTISGPSHLALVTQGYAVLDGATMPVIGDPETMNDTFVQQIVQAAEAAVAHTVDLGVADPDRVAVGGHSYGAFMVANLLAHSDLFKAGIARSGAYNRTLTPFGFQSERRTLWEAPEIYSAVSPFFHADRIDEPLLLVHGAVDNNSGTYPMQSERLFQAIKGHGGTARLVMLPNESHGYRARESVLHVLAETLDWLDRWLAPAPPESAYAPAGG